MNQGDRFSEKVSRSSKSDTFLGMEKDMLWGVVMFAGLAFGIYARQGEITSGVSSMVSLAVLFLILAIFDK